jgi:hypothetical protein
VTLAIGYDIDVMAKRTGNRDCRITVHPTLQRSYFWFAKAIPRVSRTGETWSKATLASSRPTPRPAVEPDGTTCLRGPMHFTKNWAT